MRHIKNSRHHVPDTFAESLYGQAGAILVPLAALGVCRTSESIILPGHSETLQKMSVCGSFLLPKDLTGGDDSRQLWYGKVVVLPEIKFRKPEPGLIGTMANQFMCTDFADPSRWGQQIFGKRTDWRAMRPSDE